MISEKQTKKIRRTFNGTKQRLIFKILGDTNRYRIFEMLAKKPGLSVSNIAKILRVSIPLTSQHLKILEQAKILKKDKRGQKTFFTIDSSNLLAGLIIAQIL